VSPVRVDVRGAPDSDGSLARLAERVLAGEGIYDAEVCISIVDETTMTNLNRRYTGRDGVTDVLAFPLSEGDEGQYAHGHLGDVVVCEAQARRQARELCIDPGGELNRLVVHGILHLLGYDHADEAGGRRMHAAQETYVNERWED
jgi:probable rRNA maturation factor